MSSFQYALLCLLSFCTFCSGRQYESTVTYAGPKDIDHGRPGRFLHRHSFGCVLDQPLEEATTFQLVDAADVLGASFDHTKLATFSLRALQYPPEVSSVFHKQIQADLHWRPTLLPPGADVRPAPNTTDKETVVNLAKMTSDAYLFDPNEPDWLNTSLGFNFTSRLPWKDDGLRGHVFSTEDYGIVIVSFKGTTIDPRDKLAGRDAINDNKLFSCCCRAQNPYHYKPVCNCSTGYYQCSSSCVTESLLQSDSYYDIAMYIMGRIQIMYPNATYWVVGHSLGGSLASLVGLTLNIPAVTFEAPPERLAAERIGLIPVDGSSTITSLRATAHHFGHTADPAYMGACNGFFSSCAFWDLSFESQCFTGRRCVYDTVKDKGWRSSIAYHRINYVIPNVLEAYEDVPICEEDTDCKDCYLWNFS